jgi:hypothetical protein
MSSNSEVPSAELVLAAIDRAIRQSIRPVAGASAGSIADHLALNRRSGAWRQALRLLRELEDGDGVEKGRRNGVAIWSLTDKGRERMARFLDDAQHPSLPESPHHRRWQDSRRLAAREADRFRAELSTALEDGLQLLDDATIPSAAWLALATRLARAAERVGAVVYCLSEWPEPAEGGPDLSDGPRMRSRARFGDLL